MTEVSVIVPVYNNEGSIGPLVEALLAQSKPAQEIIVVDDGCTDRTAEILMGYADSGKIRYFRKENGGAASARNAGWSRALSPICAFTDADCLPEADWLQTLVAPLQDPEIAAVGGTYRTLNDKSWLADFIGLEIDYRYRKVEGRVDCHGTYNLAVRRKVLEELGGFDESYRNSSEDWDLTYRLSNRYSLVFNRRAVVAHLHPENVLTYLRIQHVRARERMRLYRQHPKKRGGDSYTENAIKFRLVASALLPATIVPWLLGFAGYPLFLFQVILILTGVDIGLFYYLWKKRRAKAFFGSAVQYLRNFAWISGIAQYWSNGHRAIRKN